MKSLTNYISEKLVINKNYDAHTYHPTTPDELRQIILDRYDKQGPETKKEPVDFNDIDVSEMTTFFLNIKRMGIFEDTRFEYIDVSDWDVSSVENMEFTFCNCRSLKELDLSSWNISNVKDMTWLFAHCKSLNKLNISNWSVSNVKDMAYMFVGCKKEIVPYWYKNIN